MASTHGEGSVFESARAKQTANHQPQLENPKGWIRYGSKDRVAPWRSEEEPWCRVPAILLARHPCGSADASAQQLRGQGLENGEGFSRHRFSRVTRPQPTPRGSATSSVGLNDGPAIHPWGNATGSRGAKMMRRQSCLLGNSKAQPKHGSDLTASLGR
jgi:hypothetical protein